MIKKKSRKKCRKLGENRCKSWKLGRNWPETFKKSKQIIENRVKNWQKWVKIDQKTLKSLENGVKHSKMY